MHSDNRTPTRESANFPAGEDTSRQASREPFDGFDWTAHTRETRKDRILEGAVLGAIGLVALLFFGIGGAVVFAVVSFGKWIGGW